MRERVSLRVLQEYAGYSTTTEGTEGTESTEGTEGTKGTEDTKVGDFNHIEQLLTDQSQNRVLEGFREIEDTWNHCVIKF